MVCIYCGQQTSVTNSRKTVRSHTTWRRRRCKACEAVFTTFEGIDLSQSLSVRSGASTFAPFDRDKLFISIYESCRHRKHAMSDATALTQTVISNILQQLRSQEIKGAVSKNEIVNTTLQVLGRFDSAAAMHYTVYYAERR